MALNETLELDVTDALHQVDKVDEALARSATSFGVALADALDVLRTPPLVDLTADTSSITPAVEDALNAADLSLNPAVGEVTGTAAITEDIDAAVKAADTTVEVNADTSSAEEAIASLGAEATAGGKAGEGLAAASEHIAVATELATGKLSALRGVLPGGPAAAGILAVAAGTLELAKGALRADEAERQFTRSTGDLAEQIRALDIGGLTGDLDQLAVKAGSTPVKLQLASSKLFDLGVNAGQSRQEVAKTVQQIDALALRAVVLRPQLGDAGDAADGLTRALARGGRFAAQYGIALTSAEINTRALEIATARGSTEVTQFDKTAAGAQLTVQRLGGTLGADFAANVSKPEVALKSLRAQFETTLETLGKPLIAGVLAEANAGQPILLDLGRALAGVAQAVVPLAVDLTRDLAPAVHDAAGAAVLLADAVGPVVRLLGEIPAPLVSTVALALALRPVLSAVAAGFLRAQAGAVAFTASVAEEGVTGALAGLVSPVTLAAVGVGLLVTVFVNASREGKRLQQGTRDLTAEILKQDLAFGDLALKKTTDSLRSRNQLDDLNRIGLTTREVTRLALQGRAGFADFIGTLGETGEISRKSADALIPLILNGRGVQEAINEINDKGQVLVSGNQGLLRSFEELRKQLVGAARDALTQAQAQGTLSAAEIQTSEKRHTSLDRSGQATVDFIAVLRELLPVQAAVIAGTTGQADALDQAAASAEAAQATLDALADAGDAVATATRILGPSFETLALQFLRGTVNVTDLNLAISGTPLTLDQLQAALAETKTQMASFVDAYVQGIPKITGASADLAKDKSLDQFLADLHKKTLDEAAFVHNIAVLKARGAVALAGTFAEAGLAAASQAAAAEKLGETALAKKEAQRRRDEALNAATVVQARQLGTDVYLAQQDTLNRLATLRPPDLRTPLVHAIRAAHEGALRAADLTDVGLRAGETIGAGLDISAPAIFRAAERAARKVKLAAIQELGDFSPSRLVLNTPTSTATANPASAPTLTAPRPSGVRTINVYQAGKSPEETAFVVDALLGQEVQR